MKFLRTFGVEIAGWTLLIVGIAALVLPGPGLLAMFAGLALLSQRYAWASRWVEPVRLRALRAAADSVQTVPRIIGSSLGVALLFAAGVLWILGPDQPGWWSLPDWSWLPGGTATGITQIASGFIAGAMIAYSVRRFRNNPDELRELDRDVAVADDLFDGEAEGAALEDRPSREP